jgi:tetratricopeptide (TPR) repeat protein
LAREICLWAGRLIVIYGLAVLVLWGFYGFRFQARPDGLPLWSGFAAYAALLRGHVARWALTTAGRFKLLPQSYLFGLIDVLIITAGPRISFLRGNLYPHALWYYFPVAFVIKSTIGFLGMLILGLAAFRNWAGESYRKAAYLLIPPALLLGAALTAGTNLGVRHILPIYPFLILAAAAGAWELVRRGKAWAIVVAVLMISHMASSLHTLPNYLAYSNELFGGTANTYRNLSDSNADWGQGLLEARQYLAHRNIKDCWFAYIGTADTAYYHLPCKMLPNPFLKRQDAIPPASYHGVVLISGTNIAGSYFGAGALNPYSDFLRLKPVANIGGSVLVYEGDIDLRRAAAIAHMFKAWEFFGAKNQEAAIQEALKAGDLAPDHPGPPYIVGYILAQAHRTEAARAQFEDSLKLAEAAHPEFQPVWANAARAQLARLPK